MEANSKITRQEAIETLKNYGIKGEEIYLIDMIPLLEMIWADGKAQREELEILNNYLLWHVDHVNSFSGTKLLSLETGKAFIRRFTKEKPSPDLLRTLRAFLTCLRLTSNEPSSIHEEIRESLLAACLDIGTVSKTSFDGNYFQQFDPAEKRCFFEIIDTLEGLRTK